MSLIVWALETQQSNAEFGDVTPGIRQHLYRMAPCQILNEHVSTPFEVVVASHKKNAMATREIRDGAHEFRQYSAVFTQVSKNQDGLKHVVAQFCKRPCDEIQLLMCVTVQV